MFWGVVCELLLYIGVTTGAPAKTRKRAPARSGISIPGTPPTGTDLYNPLPPTHPRGDEEQKCDITIFTRVRFPTRVTRGANVDEPASRFAAPLIIITIASVVRSELIHVLRDDTEKKRTRKKNDFATVCLFFF